MKVGDGNANAASHEELLARMQRAHRQEATEGVDGAQAATDAAPAQSLGAVGGAGAGAEPSELQSRLLETAARALDGDFDSADALRGEVVEAIVEQRYADGVPDEQLDGIKDTVRATLTGDPVFRDEVDNMLVLAARELARTSD
ncbi:MAG: hypothetical protein ACOC9W_00695 [Persicimonas sp.]